jgi:beta-lactamase class A
VRRGLERGAHGLDDRERRRQDPAGALGRMEAATMKETSANGAIQAVRREARTSSSWPASCAGERRPRRFSVRSAGSLEKSMAHCKGGNIAPARAVVATMLNHILALAIDLVTLAAPARGTVGIVAVHLETGHRVGLHENDLFPLESVFKLPVAIEVLAQVDAGRLALDQPVALVEADRRGGMGPALAVPARTTVGALLEEMLVRSDNTACDKLLALVGGPAVVGARMKALGLPEIAIVHTEKELAAGKGGNVATPAALAELVGKLARAELGLAPPRQALLRALLGRVETGTARLKAGLPSGAALEHKTGTGPVRQGLSEATNDVGLVTLPDGTHLALAVFVRDARADEATRERTIADVARAAVTWATADRP